MATTSVKDENGGYLKQVDERLPSWDGDYATFLDYKTRVLLVKDSFKDEDLPLLAPRLARNLVGRAWEVVPDLERDKLKEKDGVDYLVGALEKLRGKEKLDLLGDAFCNYFSKNEAKRKDKEDLLDYLARYRQFIRDIETALKSSGVKGEIPKELYGWMMLQHIRLDPSEIAAVKSRTNTYGIDDVTASLRQMWNGNSLSARDSDRKTGNKAHAAWTVEEVQQGWTDARDYEEEDYLNEMEDEDYVEMAEIVAWYHDAVQKFEDDPTNETVAINFRDARKAMAESRTNRGFYAPTKGKGKSKGFNGSCLRCGRFGHRAFECPQRPAGTGGKGSSSKGATKGGKGDSTKTTPVGYIGYVYFGGEMENEYRQMAILDSGATANVMGVEAAECWSLWASMSIRRRASTAWSSGGSVSATTRSENPSASSPCRSASEARKAS